MTVARVDPAAIAGYRAANPTASMRQVAAALNCSPASVCLAVNGRPAPRPPAPGSGREFTEAELIPDPAPAAPRVTAGERSVDRRRAELVMQVGAAR